MCRYGSLININPSDIREPCQSGKTSVMPFSINFKGGPKEKDNNTTIIISGFCSRKEFYFYPTNFSPKNMPEAIKVNVKKIVTDYLAPFHVMKSIL